MQAQELEHLHHKGKKPVDIPAVHLWIYKKIRDKHGIGLMRRAEVAEMIRRTIYQIPKNFDYLMFEEMCEYKLIQKIDRLKCRVLKTNCEAKLKKLQDYFFF